MLHITNGDSVVNLIHLGGLDGATLSWDDTLHEGPVPAGLDLPALSAVRARYVTSAGWATEAEATARFTARDTTIATAPRHDEAVLWFEHDLYDQLQLIQLLDWFSDPAHRPATLTAVLTDEHLGPLPAERAAPLFAARRPVTPAKLDLGRRAWAAFRAPDPTALLALLDSDTSALPHLAPAIRRLLEEYPSVEDGLGRTEHTALELVAAGVEQPAALFARTAAREEALFMGDTAFWSRLYALADGPSPLLEMIPDGAEAHPGIPPVRFRLTATGHGVLNGDTDAVHQRGLDRWIGGVHLTGHAVPWRWDRRAGTLRIIDSP